MVLLLSEIKRRSPIDTAIDKGYTSTAVKGIHLLSCLVLDKAYKSENLGLAKVIDHFP